jgi:hypothetical protein
MKRYESSIRTENPVFGKFNLAPFTHQPSGTAVKFFLTQL